MTTDVLVKHGARVLATMVLIYFNQNAPIYSTEGLDSSLIIV